MGSVNKLERIVGAVNRLPGFARHRALTALFRRAVPFTGTVGIEVEELTPQRCVIGIDNRRRVQNHIGSVHAVASLLLAESATGFLVGMNLSDECVPVIKTIRADFVKRAAKGRMTVTASLTPGQVGQIRTSDKGETAVQVELRDQDEREPIVFEMIWAWTPRVRS